MKFDPVVTDFLSGKKFTNSLTIPYSFREPIPDRVKLLSDMASGKNVIHLGCLDHLPLIDEKIARNQWLHKELTGRARKCIGIDIHQEAKDHVEKKYGFTNILIEDFTTTRSEKITSEKWDFAILGELLEHIDNPVAFLQSIKNNYTGCLDRLIITVPNAWTRTTIRAALNNTEIINSDHRYWFTPYTLAKVIFQSGMQMEDIYFANRVPLSMTGLVRNKLLKIVGKEPRYNFTYASSIVAIARLL